MSDSTYTVRLVTEGSNGTRYERKWHAATEVFLLPADRYLRFTNASNEEVQLLLSAYDHVEITEL